MSLASIVEDLRDPLDPDVRDGFDQADLCVRPRSVKGRDSASFVPQRVYRDVNSSRRSITLNTFYDRPASTRWILN